MTWKKMGVIVFPAMALTLFASGGAPAANLVTNGGFETTTSGPGQFDFLTQATGWTSTNGNDDAYNFIFSPGIADTTGTNGQYGNLQLWGPGNGSNNGLPATSPDGGNYVAADGAFQNGTISQTITGLNPGDDYIVGFWWAGAQQSGFTGDTTEQWQVSFGAQTQSTGIVNNASHGFTGWTYEAFTFTADSPSELLSFLAFGTPNGVPPFVLLDGVSINAVPEPGSLLLWAFGLIALGVARFRRRTKRAAV